MQIAFGLSKTAFSADAPLVTEALSLYQTYLYDIEREKREKECEREGGMEGGRNEGRREREMDYTIKASK